MNQEEFERGERECKDCGVVFQYDEETMENCCMDYYMGYEKVMQECPNCGREQ